MSLHDLPAPGPAYRHRRRKITTGSDQKCAAQLADDNRLLDAHNDRRKAQHKIAGNSDLVLTQLIVPPSPYPQVERAVHFDNDSPAIGS